MKNEGDLSPQESKKYSEVFSLDILEKYNKVNFDIFKDAYASLELSYDYKLNADSKETSTDSDNAIGKNVGLTFSFNTIASQWTTIADIAELNTKHITNWTKLVVKLEAKKIMKLEQ
ncbi:hypothetical protein [Spiroplasma culicicola]|uniref:Uncharacterized protein n=1 Tax=Spiroplasma culicicola AES-1 TaxID=1276246 RepID=W6A6K6_9MOLU|nr:hypothetical protein [Spiroplasma culicicola]AHI52505.1 hypothetical protein SCULI_v1c01640 [Spiroplasma culicicola AES-1]